MTETEKYELTCFAELINLSTLLTRTHIERENISHGVFIEYTEVHLRAVKGAIALWAGDVSGSHDLTSPFAAVGLWLRIRGIFKVI